MPLLSYQDKSPAIASEIRVAPTAVLSGEVTVGRNGSIGFGAVLAAESGPIHIGDNCVIMDAAILRGIRDNPLGIADSVLIGSHAYLTGCTVERNAFIATGAKPSCELSCRDTPAFWSAVVVAMG